MSLEDWKKVEPKLIKKGDPRVQLGFFKAPPHVDCLIVAEEYYQAMVRLIKSKYTNQDVNRLVYSWIEDNNLLRCDNLESYEGIKPGSYNNG